MTDEQKKAAKKAYYEANKKKIKEYYQANKESLKDRQKKYRQDNKENIKANRKKYYKVNKEKIKANTKKYYQANKEKMIGHSMDSYRKQKTDYTIVYLLPKENYVGITNALNYRMSRHRGLGRDTSDYRILAKVDNRKDALELEALIHQEGYNGAKGWDDKKNC